MNNDINSVECRFPDDDTFLSEKGIKRVLNDVYDIKFETIEGNNLLEDVILKNILKYEKEKQKALNDKETNKVFKSVSSDGRISINIRIDKNYANIIYLAYELAKTTLNLKNNQLSITDDNECIKNVNNIIQFVLSSVHINKGLELCIIKIFNKIYTSENKTKYKENDNYISIDVIKDYIRKNIIGEIDTTKQDSVSFQNLECPFKKACKNLLCELITQINGENIFVLDEKNFKSALENLKLNNVIEENESNEYRIKPLISV